MDDLYDPWDEIAARQACGTVEFRPELGAYEVLTHGVIVDILKDPITFSSRQTTMYSMAPSVASLDPPVHTPLRRSLLGAFSKGAVAELTSGVEEYANELIDALPRPGSVVDLKQHYAVPLASLVWAYLGDTIDRDAVSRNIAVLFNGGNGTTATLITNAVYELEHAPDQKEKFLARPAELVSGFVEEALRFEGSTHGLFRTATAETEVGDAVLHDGDRVFCRFGAGSRDERAFAHPDHFEIERDWSQSPPHLAFGLGAHFCLGAPLARAEIAVALTTLYQRLPGLRLAPSDADQRLTGLIFRGWQRLHVTYSDRI